MQLKKITSKFVKNKRVLVRTDYNVPLKKQGKQWLVADDTRLKITLPTLKFLLKHQAKIIINFHFGRPGGKVVEKYRVDPVAKHLAKLLGKPVKKIDVPAGPEAEKAVAAMKAGDILMLENPRFHPGEKTNDPQFAKQLAGLADVFINDGLASSHRDHASVTGVAKLLPSAAGFALIKEVEMLEKLMSDPDRPFVAVVGGAKISDKVDAIRNLSKIADVVLVGGGVANNFLKADGIDVYHSYLEDAPADIKKKKMSFVTVAENLIEETKSEKMMLHDYIPLPKILYPSDVLAADDLEKPTRQKTIVLANGNSHERKRDWMFVDIGPKTQKLYRDIILQAKTVFWNGPMGVFEKPAFANGTKAVAQAMAKTKAKTIVGGGDTIRAIKELGVENHYDYVSAAGGAALEFLGGEVLVGLKPLLTK
jgi:phosphoglycerate kinase